MKDLWDRFIFWLSIKFGNWSQKGAGSFSSYWWLVGVRGKINIFSF